MSRYAREHPDDPESWDSPRIFSPVRRCWCGRPIPAGSISACGCCCTEHDDPREGPDPP